MLPTEPDTVDPTTRMYICLCMYVYICLYLSVYLSDVTEDCKGS